MANIDGRDGQIFQFGHRRVQAACQRDGFPGLARVRQQFAGLFANLAIERHGLQQRNKRLPIIRPALLLARVFQRLARDVFCDGGVADENFVPGDRQPVRE